MHEKITGEGGVRNDRQPERAAEKRPRQQVKHTKIAWQQLCHKIQGLVLSLWESERRGGGSQELHVHVWRRRKTGMKCVRLLCDAWCVCVRDEGWRDSTGKKNLQKASKNPFHVWLGLCFCVLVISTHRPGIAFSAPFDSVTDTECLQHIVGLLSAAASPSQTAWRVKSEWHVNIFAMCEALNGQSVYSTLISTCCKKEIFAS